MGKTKKQFPGDSQPSLFEMATDVNPGQFDQSSETRAIITDTLRSHQLSREQIADEMTRITGKQITARMLYHFSAESEEQHRFPLEWAAAFCQATNDFRLFNMLVRPFGARFVSASQIPLLELAETLVAKEQTEQQYRYRLGNVLSQRQAR